jgi:hypothetical protein
VLGALKDEGEEPRGKYAAEQKTFKDFRRAEDSK